MPATESRRSPPAAHPRELSPNHADRGAFLLRSRGDSDFAEHRCFAQGAIAHDDGCGCGKVPDYIHPAGSNFCAPGWAVCNSN
jgi:hypothetical protein